MNSVGIPGGFRVNAGFSGNLGVKLFGGGFGRFGASKVFCANSQPVLGLSLWCFNLRKGEEFTYPHQPPPPEMLMAKESSV